MGQLLPRETVIDASAHGEWKFPLTPLALPALSAPYFVFNIHAGDLALERRWPRQHFQALIARLLALRPDAIAVLIGHGTSERAYTAPLADPTRILDLSGQLSLTETVRLLANADLVVSNDTAPLHLAYRWQHDAADVGFDWPTIDGVNAKLQEELAEFEEAAAAQDPAAIEHELGDVLFSLVNLARWHHVQPDMALRKANQRFAERFRLVEAQFLSLIHI